MLSVSKSGLARLWPFEVGLFRLFDRPQEVIRIGIPGISDLVGITCDGKFLAVEVKSGRGQLRESQIRFREMIRKFNGIFIVGRDPMQVVGELKQQCKAQQK